MEKLAATLVKHLEGILNYCRTKVPMGVVEAINGNIKALLRRGRGYRNLSYLLLQAQRLAVTKTQFLYSCPMPQPDVLGLLTDSHSRIESKSWNVSTRANSTIPRPTLVAGAFRSIPTESCVRGATS